VRAVLCSRGHRQLAQAFLLDRASLPTPTNPLGVKGAGEAGTVGSLSAGVNAIVDALSVLGIRHIDMPCTPYRVWQAIANAGARVTIPFTEAPPLERRSGFQPSGKLE